jgi:hypothetical protein
VGDDLPILRSRYIRLLLWAWQRGCEQAYSRRISRHVGTARRLLELSSVALLNAGPAQGLLTNALDSFGHALKACGIDPHGVEVSLPVPHWRYIARQIETERGDAAPGHADRLEIGGVRYLVRFAAKGR